MTIDLRGHGRSERPTAGNDLDTLSGDVLAVMDALDLHGVVLIGQSMGGTVVAHAAGGLGSPRLARVVLSAPITPCPDHERRQRPGIAGRSVRREPGGDGR